MQGHSNKIKQEFGLTDFPKASLVSFPDRATRLHSACLIDGQGCSNYLVM